MFRLHIDIPLSNDEEKATKFSQAIMDMLPGKIRSLQSGMTDVAKIAREVTKVQFRLANDEDRSIRNYLIKDSEGHVSTKKTKVEL